LNLSPLNVLTTSMNGVYVPRLAWVKSDTTFQNDSICKTVVAGHLVP